MKQQQQTARNNTKESNNDNKKKKGQSQEKDKLDNINSHWDQISKIKQENINLREEIDTEIRYSSKNDAIQGAKMQKLQEEGSLYAKKIEIENKRMRDLQQQIEITQQNLYEKKKQMNSSDGTEVPHLQKVVKNLEYKLEKTRQRHNESLAEIKRLKEEVNAARRERVIFDNVFKKLEMDLKQKEEELKCQLFETLQVENQRNLAKEYLAKIKNQAEKEMQNFKKEYENAFNIQELPFLENEDSKQNIENIIQGYDQSQQQSMPSEQLRLGKINSAQKINISKIQEQTQAAQQLKESEQYEILFEKIKAETNVKDIDDFIEQFQNQDEINQQLFDKSNTLIDEIENLEQQLTEMNTEIEKYTSIKQTDEQINQQSELFQLKIKLKEAEEKNIKLELQNQDMNSELDYLTKQIPDIFEKIGCKLPNDRKIQDEQINSSNILQYLAIIEQRANEIIELASFLDNKNYDSVIMKKGNLADNSSLQNTLNSKLDNTETTQNLQKLLESVEKSKECEKIKTDKEFREEGKLKIQDILKQSGQKQGSGTQFANKQRKGTKKQTLNNLNNNNSNA